MGGSLVGIMRLMRAPVALMIIVIAMSQANAQDSAKIALANCKLELIKQRIADTNFGEAFLTNCMIVRGFTFKSDNGCVVGDDTCYQPDNPGMFDRVRHTLGF